MGDELLLNFGAKFQRSFTISHVRLQYYPGNLLYVSMPRWQQSFFKKYYEWRCQGIKRRFRKLKFTNEHIKKDSIRYYVEKFWKL